MSYETEDRIQKLLAEHEAIEFSSTVWRKQRIWRRRNIMLTNQRIFLLDNQTVEL